MLWMTAITSLITALTTIGLLVVAVFALRGAVNQLRLLQEQNHEQTRPYVVADIVPGMHGAGTWDLVVTNLGRSIALGVTIDIGPFAPQNERDTITEPLKRYLTTPRTLAPGARQRVMWRSDWKDMGRHFGAPRTASGRVTYADNVGIQYEEEYDLSVEGVAAATPVPTKGNTELGAGMELRNIELALRTLNVHVGELRR